MFLNPEFHEKISRSKFYYFILGVSSFFMMLFAFIPFEVVLVPAVAGSSTKWKKIVLVAVIGSAAGAAVLSLAFEHFGWRMIDYLLPHLTTSKEWNIVEGWFYRYGAWSLCVTSSLPVAQAPVIAIAGLFKVPAYEVFFAFLIGKTIKYSLISYAVVRSEQHFLRPLKAAYLPADKNNQV